MGFQTHAGGVDPIAPPLAAGPAFYGRQYIAAFHFEKLQVNNYLMVLGTEFWKDVSCDAFLRHKRMTCTPQFLLSRGIQVFGVKQLAGEYVVVLPKSPHFGYNKGLNVAEAANFTLNNHKHLLRSSEGYNFKVCKSGLQEIDSNHTCAIGFNNCVPELYESDCTTWPRYEDRPKEKAGKQRVKARGKSRAKSARWSCANPVHKPKFP